MALNFFKRNKYHSKTQSQIIYDPIDESKIPLNERYCRIHHDFHPTSTTCPRCSNEYYCDMRDKVYPPGINDSNKSHFYLEHWQALRYIEMKRDTAKAKATSEQEKRALDEAAEREVMEYLKNNVLNYEKRIQKQKEARQREENDRRRNYAGYGQYSKK